MPADNRYLLSLTNPTLIAS